MAVVTMAPLEFYFKKGKREDSYIQKSVTSSLFFKKWEEKNKNKCFFFWSQSRKEILNENSSMEMGGERRDSCLCVYVGESLSVNYAGRVSDVPLSAFALFCVNLSHLSLSLHPFKAGPSSSSPTGHDNRSIITWTVGTYENGTFFPSWTTDDK